MSVSSVAEELAREFYEEPHNFVTKMDLQVRLVELLRSHLRERNEVHAVLGAPFLRGATVSYKEKLQATIQERMEETAEFDRVHNDVSVEQGHHYNVAVFSECISNPIDWISNGSKRFHEEDLDAVFELEFIINKPYFYTDCSIRDPEILSMDQAALREELQMEENNIRPDLEALGRLPDDVETFYLLFSNNNYLYHEPLTRDEKAEQQKVRVGKAAQKQIRTEANEADTTVFYAHPRGYTTLTS